MNIWDKMHSYIEAILDTRTLSDEEFLERLSDGMLEVLSLENESFSSYINKLKLQEFHRNNDSLFETARQKSGILYLFKRSVREESRKFTQLYSTIDEEIQKSNEEYCRKQKDLAKDHVLPVEGKMLDDQQLSALVKEEPNHLVVAGAGTGKTTTIVGYIKYLVSLKNVDPDKILVLSFTNASAHEMAERVKKEIGADFDVSTFHKLGLNIITDVTGVKPAIYSDNILSFVKNSINEHIKDKAYLSRLCSFAIFYSNVDKSPFEFSSLREYQEFIKYNPPTTLKGEKVKSYGEVMIANFLAMNSINYQYEAQYKYETATYNYSQYKPDFYLPDYDIYIEYYGIDRYGNVPSYFSSGPGQSASERYREGMRWKRELHRENGTTCIELFAYEHFENTLLESLAHQLKDRDVRFSYGGIENLWNTIKNDRFDNTVELFATLINLIKSNDIDFDELRRRNQTLNRPLNIEAYISVLEPVYNDYQKMLQDTRQIDFNDMINYASRYVEEGQYHHHYDYVIVDEYQDISQSRYKLLYQMREQKNYNLFCVGDDWQSIYRFSGSDIGFILAFEKYWGLTEIDKIETTYRFPRSLIGVSGTFIMDNPCQIKKSLKSPNGFDQGFALEEIHGYTEKAAFQFMFARMRELPENSSILLLGRYRFDIKVLDQIGIKYKYVQSDGRIHVYDEKRKDLSIIFMTAHASKGLQADYTFIINNKEKGMGFPSTIQNAPIMELLLDDSDDFPFSEERRLFYVAMTRSKKKTFLVTVEKNESAFIRELKDLYEEDLLEERYRCPVCGGHLVLKHGKYGDFFGCANYQKGCKFIRKVKSAKDTNV